MIIDTLVIVVCLVAGTPKQNRFEKDFQRADSLFIQASMAALHSACEKTKKEQEKAIRLLDMQAIVDKLKYNSVKP